MVMGGGTHRRGSRRYLLRKTSSRPVFDIVGWRHTYLSLSFNSSLLLNWLIVRYKLWLMQILSYLRSWYFTLLLIVTTHWFRMSWAFRMRPTLTPGTWITSPLRLLLWADLAPETGGWFLWPRGLCGRWAGNSRSWCVDNYIWKGVISSTCTPDKTQGFIQWEGGGGGERLSA